MHEIAGFRIPQKSSCRKAERVPVDSVDQTLAAKDPVAPVVKDKDRDRIDKTGKSWGALAAALVAFCLASGTALAQQTEQKKDDIPDAPSASRPFPGNLPPPSNPSNPAPPAGSDEPTYAPGVAPPPPMKVTTVPQGGATEEGGVANDELFKIRS